MTDRKTANEKTAYYQSYDPSALEMGDFSVAEDMCDAIEGLESELFDFGKDMIRLSKSLEGMEKSEISSKIQSIVGRYCEDYLEGGDGISNLDDYDGLELEEDEDEDEDEEEEYEDEEEEYEDEED